MISVKRVNVQLSESIVSQKSPCLTIFSAIMFYVYTCFVNSYIVTFKHARIVYSLFRYYARFSMPVTRGVTPIFALRLGIRGGHSIFLHKAWDRGCHSKFLLNVGIRGFTPNLQYAIFEDVITLGKRITGQMQLQRDSRNDYVLYWRRRIENTKGKKANKLWGNKNNWKTNTHRTSILK